MNATTASSAPSGPTTSPTTARKRAEYVRRQRPLTERAHHLDTLPAGALLDVKDLEALFNVGRVALWRWVAAGRAPAPFSRGAWTAGSVRDFLAQQGQR